MRFFSSSKTTGRCGAMLGALLLALVAPPHARAQGTAIVPTYTQTLKPSISQTLCNLPSLNSSGTLLIKNATDVQDQGVNAHGVDRVGVLKFDLSQVKAPIVSARLLFDGFMNVDAAFPKQPAPLTITTQVLEATNWPSSPSFSNLPATGSGTSVSVSRNASNPKLNGPTMHFGPDETQVVRSALTSHPTCVGWVWKNSNGTPHTHSDYSNAVLELTFNKKVWSVDNGILGGDLVKPAVQQGPLTQVLTVEQGTSLDVELSQASDTDHWALNGKEGDEDDKTLTYKWTADAGQFSSPDSAANKWTAPLLAPGVDSMTITITGQVNNDNPPPFGPDETGHRDDKAVTHSFTVMVKRPMWSADPAIGQHRDPDTHQLVPDGRMIAPQDQRGNYDKAKGITIQPGARIPIEIEGASDLDTLTPVNGTPSEAADEVNYRWEATREGGGDDKGSWEWQVMKDGQLVTEKGDTAPTTKATWIAPSDITEDTTFTLKCTVEDTPLAVNKPKEGGERDDEALERSVRVNVAVSNVTFEGLARAAAGGVAADGVHSFTITGTAKLTDDSVIVSKEYILSFENNKGKVKRAKFIPDTQAGQTLIDKSDGEQMKVMTDAQGKFGMTVMSSDIISSDIKVKVRSTSSSGEGADVGEQMCDFAEAQSARRYGIIELNQGYGGDHGWDFDPEFLFDHDDRSSATLYLRFRKDPSKAIDQKFFLIAGAKASTIDTNGDNRISATEMAAATARDSEEHHTNPALKLDDADNWLPVNGHDLQISVGEVTVNGETVAPTRDHLYFVNADGQPIDQNGNPFPDPDNFVLPPFVPAATADRGTTKKEKGVTLPIYLRAGPLINQVTSLSLYVTDTTQKNP